MDRARSLYRRFQQPHNTVPPSPLPRDKQGWRVAPAPDGRGTPTSTSLVRRTGYADSGSSWRCCWR